MFTHGDVFNHSHPCSIKAELQEVEGTLTFLFEVTNKIKITSERQKSGFGLKTIENLLNHYFPDSNLKETKTKSHYSIILTIPYGKDNQTWPYRR